MSSMICPMTGTWCGSTGCFREQCSLRAAKERNSGPGQPRAPRFTLDRLHMVLIGLLTVGGLAYLAIR